MPSVQETLQTIHASEAALFTKSDAQKRYHQIPLDEASKDLTTFTTPFGRFRFERAPYGINTILDNVARVVDDSLVYG